MHPKVKVPAVVSLVIACVLAVLSILSQVPALVFYVQLAQALVTTAAGYLTYS